MFSNISWQDYLAALLIFLVIYYGYVLLVYFRKDILKISTNGIALRTNNDQKIETKEIFKEEEANALLFSSVHELMEELRETFISAETKKYPREELIMALQLRLKNYKNLKGTAFQVSVNNHIAKESMERCSILLEDNELKNLW